MAPIRPPTATELINNAVVQVGMDQAWIDSQPNDTVHRHEEGGLDLHGRDDRNNFYGSRGGRLPYDPTEPCGSAGYSRSGGCRDVSHPPEPYR